MASLSQKKYTGRRARCSRKGCAMGWGGVMLLSFFVAKFRRITQNKTH